MICAEFVCTNIVFLLCGYDAPQMNQTMMSTIASHIPAGTSTYTILHYAQEIKNGMRAFIKFTRSYHSHLSANIYQRQNGPDIVISIKL